MRTEIVKERNLMWFHPVQACRRKAKGITTPSIDLARCRSPENLIEHHVGLQKR
jgi:hypothetical protein